MKIFNQSGVIPLIVIYIILAATAFGGLAGITAYLLTDSASHVFLFLSIAVVLCFIIPVIPELVTATNNRQKRFKNWCRRFDKGGGNE